MYNNLNAITFSFYQDEKEFTKDNYYLNSFIISSLRKAQVGV